MAARPSRPSSETVPPVTVPKVTQDPIWSLRPWPIVITVGRDELEIPALPATDWLVLLMRETPDFEGILELAPGFEDALMDADLSIEEYYKTCLDVIAAASGRPWWIALRLIQVARKSWNVIGAEMIIKHVDPEVLSLSAWLDALLLLIMRTIEAKDAMMFTMQLEAIPVEALGADVDPMESTEMSPSAFAAFGG